LHFPENNPVALRNLVVSLRDSQTGLHMSQKYIILRSQPASIRGSDSPADLPIEIEEISTSKAADLTRRSDIKAVAPAMPMQLIAPVAEQEVATTSTTGGSTWGIKAVQANTSPLTGDGIVVAVLDTGIDAAHPAFAGMNLIQQDFTGDGNGDTEGHGTHCAGTIFGRDVNGSRIGVARGVQTALIGKVLGSKGGSSDAICQAMMWAVNNGANVISMSLGIDFPGAVKRLTAQGVPVELATSQALAAYRANVQLFGAVAEFIQERSEIFQPTLVIAAAGNESRRDRNPQWEIEVAPPAVSSGIISVAALGESPTGLVVAPFSNTGADVAAPGVGIISAKRGGGLVALDGTSMATPHVAGLAALWAEKLSKGRGGVSANVLSDRLRGSATDEGLRAGFDPYDIGSGLVRAPQ
jgi:subtilisin family serine protease